MKCVDKKRQLMYIGKHGGFMLPFKKKENIKNLNLVEKSDYVGITQSNGQIVIVAKAIDENSSYTIEFNSFDELSNILKRHKRKIFEGSWADLGEQTISSNGKACIYVTFNKPREGAKNQNPKIKIVLNPEFKDLAINIYQQLNTQALEMQKKLNQDIFGR